MMLSQKCIERQLINQILLQQQMSSTAAMKDGPMTLRSSRQLKTLEIVRQSIPKPEDKPIIIEIQCPSHHIQPQKQQQTKQKIEKESSSAPNNEVPSVCNPESQPKRLTRSTALHTKLVVPDIDLRLEPATPENQSSVKVQEQVTCKKPAQYSSFLSISENIIICDAQSLTIKKAVSKISENDPYSYSQMRKSYRKIHKGEMQSVPYRKCHDALEGRIVTIINKIVQGRSCNKDFQGLIERMQKITTKDMMNRFIISGIHLMVKISKQKDIYDGKVIERLKLQLAQLERKIMQELGRTDFYEESTSFQNQPIVDSNGLKHRLVRRIYKIIKNKYPQRSACENRETAIKDCEKILNHEINVIGLVKFIKNKMEIPL